MTDRRALPWLAGLGALGAACLALGASLDLRSAALFHEADEFARSLPGDDPIPDAQSDWYTSLWATSSGLHQAVTPLLAGGVLAVIGLLAVLAVRWERRAASALSAGRRGLIGLALVAAFCAAAALTLLAIGSTMMAEADGYFSQFDFSTAGPVEIDQEEYDVYNALYARGSTLATMTAPLLLGALGATFVLIAVLAQRREERHRRPGATAQTEAPAAS